MKLLSKQLNGKKCIICGLENPGGVRARFYNADDGSVVTVFSFSEIHQSYPGRAHGGIICAMLDELGLRAAWTKDESVWGVTVSIETKYHKPVPVNDVLYGRGRLISSSKSFFKSRSEIFDAEGNLLSRAFGKYIKLMPEEIYDSDHNKAAKDDSDDFINEIECPWESE